MRASLSLLPPWANFFGPKLFLRLEMFDFQLRSIEVETKLG